jgi:hypothetical protein
MSDDHDARFKCCNCGDTLYVGENVFLTPRGISHVVCKVADPFDWCHQRADETQLEARERMLANVPAGLKRNIVEPCPIAEYFGLGRGATQA